MEYTTLRNSDLRVSRLCVGGCPMGGHGWGQVSHAELIAAVNRALNIGVNFFDTADVYGLGQSEKILGEALGDRRQDAIIATKFGVRMNGQGQTFYDNSPAWINHAVEASLDRLGTDYIDLYQLHYRDKKTPLTDVVDALEKLKQRGLIRYYGLSNIYASDIEELQKIEGLFVSFQDEFSLANRAHERDMLDISQKLDMSILTWGSLGQGILTGKYDAKVQFDSEDRRSREVYKNFHGDKLLHNLKIVEVMQEISRNTKKSLPAIAIRWILDYLPGSVVIAGIKSPQQLDSNASALGWTLNHEQFSKLKSISVYR